MTTSILVSWISKNHDPFFVSGTTRVLGPSLQLLFDVASPIRGTIRRFYVLAQRREEKLVDELVAAAREIDPDLSVTPMFLEEDVPPTDHRSVFVFTAKALREVHRSNARAEIAVNLSPGTPAMHTALLLTLQARLAGDKVRAFQGIPPDRRQPGDGVAREVPWNLLSELTSELADDSDDFGKSSEWRLDQAKSPQLRDVAASVRRFAPAPFPVLLMGARGTGKSHIAREIREQFLSLTVKASGKWDFHLNCAEFGGGDPNILRSALFGHDEGAFTNASKTKHGILELAAGDCVFLDEIHRMDPHAQGMLLLALQRGGTFQRLGGRTAIPAQFRLIAATNVSMAELREHLNADFLDRVSDLVIQLPPLRECHDDLESIWTSVVSRACRELWGLERSRHALGTIGSVEQMIGEFRPHARIIVQCLETLLLPGNYRDLEKLARRLLVAGFARDRIVFSLRKVDVEEQLRRLRDSETISASVSTGTSLADELPTQAQCQEYLRTLRDRGSTIDGNELVEAWTQRLFQAAVSVSASKSDAARLLNIKPRTFTERLRSK